MDESQAGKYRAMLCRFLLFLLRDIHHAEEITQEAFVVALSKGPDPAKGTNYGAWLRSIARNLVRSHVRKRRGRPLLPDDVLDAAERHFVRTGSDQADLWEARRQALSACMQKLPEGQRDLLLRRYERGQKVGHLAERLGVEPNTLSKRLERIRERLRRCIAAALQEENRG